VHEPLRLRSLLIIGVAILATHGHSGAAQSGEAQNTGVNVALPGALPMPADKAAAITQAWLQRDKTYRPRTRHLEADGSPKYTNRLYLETSPYLQQHAHNPVNWFPWGSEAFELARKLGRPVFLSIGYSTCHWCHVMEEESFEDEEIAAFLNANYVAVKVDREERPDVDSIYMSAVQRMTGRGGWPMSVWLTPDREPFYGGTYFPARDGDRGRPVGFLSLLDRLHRLYETDPDRVVRQAAEIVNNIRRDLTPVVGDLPGSALLHDAVARFAQVYDGRWGGRRGRPKFPSSFPVRLLLRYHRRTGDENARLMAEITLERMAAGGMYDQAGGGFHRYSVDEKWLVPHFEKMLYDNAQLTLAYLEGYQVTGREDFARIAREILRYVARDMTSPAGAFYSATDADSLNPEGHREEGWFFTWTPAELREVLGAEKSKVVEAYYGVTADGNFEGRNILNRPRSDRQVAAELKLAVPELLAIVESARETLYETRKSRPAPIRDEKILAAWNGLMISAYARAGLVLGEPDQVARAVKAATFVLDNMRKHGRLFRSYMDGKPRHNGYLDDYAFLIAGLLDIYEATGEVRWLREARALDRMLEKHYEDRERGGFFVTSDDHETLLAREKPSYDGAVPTGNSVHTMNLLRLAELTTEARYRARAEAAMKAVGRRLRQEPAGLTEMLLAVDFMLDLPKEVIIVAPSTRADARPLLERFGGTYVPNRILVVAIEGEHLSAQQEHVPLVAAKRPLKGKATAYVCTAGVCKLPTSDPDVFVRQLEEVTPLPDPPSQGGD
jgi:uncharacterized protein YyaL (SSP411 family)